MRHRLVQVGHLAAPPFRDGRRDVELGGAERGRSNSVASSWGAVPAGDTETNEEMTKKSAATAAQGAMSEAGLIDIAERCPRMERPLRPRSVGMPVERPRP